jgi:Thylakoid formation protein
MRQSAFLAACFASWAGLATAFFPSSPKIGGWSGNTVSRLEQKEVGPLYSDNSDRNLFGSKLMPDPSEEELAEMFKEFNITTSFDINKDPDLMKWYPSKEFFEKFGFQNMTERYKRKTMDVKVDFYAAYTKPILPQYKTFIADIMAMTFVQTIDSRYKYDALHAFGICTQYYTIMKGYALPNEVQYS